MHGLLAPPSNMHLIFSLGDKHPPLVTLRTMFGGQGVPLSMSLGMYNLSPRKKKIKIKNGKGRSSTERIPENPSWLLQHLKPGSWPNFDPFCYLSSWSSLRVHSYLANNFRFWLNCQFGTSLLASKGPKMTNDDCLGLIVDWALSNGM